MKTYIECLPCFVRQSLELARRSTDDESQQQEIMRNALERLSKLDYSRNPPQMAQDIHRYVCKLTGKKDIFEDVKKWSNETALKMLQSLHSRIDQSECKFETAVRLAIAGNIIDFGAKSHVSHEMIDEAVSSAFSWDIDSDSIRSLQEEFQKAKSIMYILDNAGEIVFDQMLIEQLPTEKVTAVVRGAPILNDVTMADAIEVGLDKIVRVIDNGTDSPGTVLDTCSKEFLAEFENADLIISKGQGNYETLNDIDKNIFFLLKVKCPVVASNIGRPLGEMVIVRQRDLERIS